MQILEIIAQNRELVKVIYALVITFICVVITFKSDKIYKLSSYKGIQYFRNAFFFYGIAFVMRYLLKFALVGVIGVPSSIVYLASKILFEFFLIMAGFFLLYSLLWKRIESPREDYTTSLINIRVFIFYLMTALIVTLDVLWETYTFLFASQILVFALIFAISFSNYQEKGKNRKFLKFYSFSMLIALIAWILNALAGFWFDWNLAVVIIIYLLNIFMFLIFWFGIINVTKRN